MADTDWQKQWRETGTVILGMRRDGLEERAEVFFQLIAWLVAKLVDWWVTLSGMLADLYAQEVLNRSPTGNWLNERDSFFLPHKFVWKILRQSLLNTNYQILKRRENVTFSSFWQILGLMRNRKISTYLNQIKTQCFRLFFKTLQIITSRKHQVQ